jgi:hypothetical protein
MLEKEVDRYEYFKTDLQILHFNKLIIGKIHRIQQSTNENNLNAQIRLLLIFLLSIEKNDKEFKKLNLKKITYNTIKKSNVIVNYYNCKKYIDKKAT